MPNAAPRSIRKVRLTKRAVEAIALPTTGELVVWDSELAGLGIRVWPTGKRTYFLYGRTTGGQQVKLKLGVHGTVTAEQARSLAHIELGKLAAGANPAQERRDTRAAEKSRLKSPTMRDLAEEYIRSYAEIHKQPSSVADDRAMLGLPADPTKKRRPHTITILGKMGTKKVADVTRRDVTEFHNAMQPTPYQANRTLCLLSKMFNLAVQWELRDDNPVRGIRRYPELPRQRALNDEELDGLAAVLSKHDSTSANAIRLLLLTGARRSEVFTATWDQFDLERGIWTKPSAHTKQKREHRVPLSRAAMTLLSEIRTAQHASDGLSGNVIRLGAGSDYVLPGRDRQKPLNDVKKFWAIACREAEITNVRLHDLRHTFASVLASSGESLLIIGQLLGHTQPSTTARYAHLFDSPVREAANRAAAALTKSWPAPARGA